MIHNVSKQEAVKSKSLFAISKEWFYVVPFLLIPFCAFPNVFLNKIQFQDLARIYFFALGTVCICTLRKDAVKKFKVTLFIALIFITCNWVSVALASLKFEINGIISSVKLTIDFFAFILIPLCGIQYTIDRISQKRLSQFYLIPVAIVILVSIIQLFLMFDIKNIISEYYSSFLYKYIEGSWGGLSQIKSNALMEFRVKSTFHEPAVLSTFFLLYVFPFVLCRYLNGYYSFGKIFDLLMIVLSFGCLIFSFSTTSYIIASINVLFIFSFSFRKRLTLKRLLFVLIICVGFIYIFVTYYETYYRIVNRVFLFKSNKDISSSTRIGSIAGALNLFKDNPLGVGFSNEKYIVYDYLPKWGMTSETSRERSNIQSHFFRYLADFGITWIIFSFAGLLIIYLKYRYKKRHLLKWQREAIFLWMTNFLLCFSFGFVEYLNQWFLLSATIIIGPIFKNNNNKDQVVIDKYQEKKVF